MGRCHPMDSDNSAVYIARKGQTMSKDTIYREDAINLLWYFQDECCSAVVGDFEKLPSADRPPGEWIRTTPWSYGAGMGEVYGYYQKCSNCGKEFMDKSNYCPNCGADMREREGE